MKTIVVSLCEILVGILLLIKPVGFTSAIIIMLGVVFTVSGICSVAGYFKTEPIISMQEQKLARGLISITAGVFCMTQSDWFLTAFPILLFLYGAAILVLGLFKVQFAVDLLRLKKKKWMLVAFSAFLNLLLAVIILWNPFNSTIVLWRIVAITLILDAVLDMVTLFLKDKSHEDK